MTHPAILAEFEKLTGKTVPPSGGIVTPPPPTPAPEIDPWDILGDTFSGIGAAWREMENPFTLYGPQHKADLRAAMANSFRTLGQRSMDYMNQVMNDPAVRATGQVGILGRIAGDFISASREGAAQSMEMARRPTDMIPIVIQGVMDMTIVPATTMMTGNVIENGEARPATAQEQADAYLEVVGTAAGAGVYSSVAAPARATITAGSVVSKTQKLGRLARTFGNEIAAESAAMVAQEAIANPADLTMQSVIQNIANPVVLVFSTGATIGGTRRANRRVRAEAAIDATLDNASNLRALPTAKQAAVNAETDVASAMNRVDALAVSDDWLEVPLRAVKQKPDESFILRDLNPDEARQLAMDVRSDVIPTKPLIDGPEYHVTPKLTTYFEGGAFDRQLMFGNLRELSTSSGISLNNLTKMKDDLVKKAKAAEVITSELNGVPYRQKVVPAVDLPAPSAAPRVYFSRNGDAMITGIPLAKEARDSFERAGAIPGERIMVKGAIHTVVSTKPGLILARDLRGRLRNVKSDSFGRIAEGSKNLWGRAEFGEDLYQRAMRFIDQESKQNITFHSLMQRFGASRNWSDADILNFENFIYRRAAEEADRAVIQPFTINEARAKQNLGMIDEMLERDAAPKRRLAMENLSANGYKTVVTSGGYEVVDFTGKRVGAFRDLDELYEMASRDFVDQNMVDLAPSPFPVSYTPVSSGMQKVHNWLDRKGISEWWVKFKSNPGFATAFRKIDKAIEDSYERQSFGEDGLDKSLRTQRRIEAVNMTTMIDRFVNTVNAAEQNIYKPVMTRVNRLIKTAEGVSAKQKAEVTRMLEQRDFNSLRNDLTPDERIASEMLIDAFREGGGSEMVKSVYIAMKRGTDDAGRAFKPDAVNPKTLAAAGLLDDLISKNFIQDERVLRYVDAIENGVDLSAEDFINTRLNWDKKTWALFKEAQEFYKEAARTFEIQGEITGYAPWITKWNGVNSIYQHSFGKESSFIHELRRIGLTFEKDRILGIDELSYRYAKTAIYHKSPVFGIEGVSTSGELMNNVYKKMAEARAAGVDVTMLEQWIQNIRGVPGFDEAAQRRYLAALEKHFDKEVRGTKLDTGMNIISLAKLGARPIMAVRDILSSYGLAQLYGHDAAQEMIKITPAKLRRISELSARGELPQFNAEEVLARYGKGKLQKATDIGMTLSGQGFTYKTIAGNMYLHTYDSVIRASRNAGGDVGKLAKELGPLLSTGSRASQEWFLATWKNDPVTAAKGLAARNAHGLANKFGRLNNPLSWQGGVGRLWGQFGSWGLNAVTTMGESVLNSNSVTEAAGKVARFSAFNYAMYELGKEAGIDLKTYSLMNPVALIPTGGPLYDTAKDIIDAFGQVAPDGTGLERAWNAALGSGTLITPTLVQDLWDSWREMAEIGDFYSGIMNGLGIRMTEEYLGGKPEPRLNIPKSAVEGVGNFVMDG